MYTSEKTGTHVPVFPLFLLRQNFKIMNDVFYEILILIKLKI